MKMREAINNNPMAQLAVVGVLLLVAGVMLAPQLLGHKKSDDSTASTTSAQLSGPTGTVDLTVKSTPAAPSSGATAGSTAAPPVSQSVSPEALVPGPGLPRPVIAAWKRGDTVVLLLVRPAGIDDRLVRDSVRSLSGDPGLAVFVARANRIARYSRITQGVGVSQVPALVIVRPRKLSGSVPQAQVTYGFRDSQAVVQAVHDAAYSGKDDLPYSPR
jgi:hypothetical protein